jgi:hypothetical protein
MWSYYKKTFPAVQAGAIAMGIIAYKAAEDRLAPALIFFLVMQLAAFVGAAWANRLRTKILGAPSCR